MSGSRPPVAVIVVVLISYLQAAVLVAYAGLALIFDRETAVTVGGVAEIAPGLVAVAAAPAAAFSILAVVMSNGLLKRSRDWRTAYLVTVGIQVSFVWVVQVLLLGGTSGVVDTGATVGVICMVLLLLPRSRAWFGPAV